jgi:hypothetical protein
MKTKQKKSRRLKGVRYVVDENGKAQAVLIDLKKNARLWEDFQDLLVCHERLKEPRIPWEEVKARLRKKGVLP